MSYAILLIDDTATLWTIVEQHIDSVVLQHGDTTIRVRPEDVWIIL